MTKMIDYGIDLGTTNSAIAKFIKGEVEIFKNPLETGRETLPSVVYYKKDKVIVGTKARENLEKDNTKSVFSAFKRKMGTTESFRVKTINQSKTPIELSAEVLKELKGFVSSGEIVEAAVITIPASFDVIQANATKESGYLAGFKQVVLLQEPIAASLAYANKHKIKDLENGRWLTYDLGGGTFDVALIKIKDGEMKVTDHEGDNFLGGGDFDNLCVEKIIIPFLNKNFHFNNLESELKSASGKYNHVYYRFLKLSEEAKITLSSRTSAEIEIKELVDDDGEDIDITIEITRSEYEGIIKETIDKTLEMIKKMLIRNSLKPSDIQFTLLVGGSTYIPYVRRRVEEILQIPINCDIDPVTAIAIGAAFYAGTKEKNFENDNIGLKSPKVKVKLAYQKTSQELEEILACKIEGNIDGLFYRITREDKGYDSGLKKAANRIQEDLPLVANSYNFFRFNLYDEQNNIVDTGVDLIGIAHGKYNVAGQPLPNDICIETDNINSGYEGINTKLDLFFQKNSILPQKQKKTYTINKTIIKGSTDKIILNILEGAQTSMPESNKQIGYIEINGGQVTRDILKNTEIEITLEMSESRDLKVTAYIPMSDQQFSEIFNSSKRNLSVEKIKNEVGTLKNTLGNEINEAVEREDYETAEELDLLKNDVADLVNNASDLTDDDVTDKKYQFEDRKRKIAQQIDDITRDKRILVLKNKYNEDKEWCSLWVNDHGNDHDRKIFNDIVGKEIIFLNSISPIKISEAREELLDLAANIAWRTPSFLETRFQELIEKPQLFNDQVQARSLIEAGNLAISSKNYIRLKEINIGLISLLPQNFQPNIRDTIIGFGQ
ncbi:Hsp70 family protein [Clostridium sp.]|uniref:Hsp70 family protein n=1 Tax=Clostridium sp. TaxID=1506 RepID=UPI00283B7FC0|nr:Hsp70 family protein [Clostridium sp.]MDR3593826.1 Hsp70 family protein [Clostridium sp.]